MKKSRKFDVTIVIHGRDEPFYTVAERVHIGRPSIYGNPFSIGKHGTRFEVIRKFKKYFEDRIRKDKKFRKQVLKLSGKVLVCYCKLKPCHGDVIKDWLCKHWRIK